MFKFQFVSNLNILLIVCNFLLLYVFSVLYKWWNTLHVFWEMDDTVFHESDRNRNSNDAPGQYAQVFPNAWYPLFVSTQLTLGQVKPIYIIGRDLVAYRTHSGKVYVLDAYCPHQGAHLGVGGSVVGDDIRCPFHNWKFNGDGICTDVPNLVKPPSAKIKSWKSCEMNNMVYIWYHEQSLEPEYLPPKFTDIEQAELCTHSHYYLYCHLMEIFANPYDLAHLDILHSCTHISPYRVLTKGFIYDLARKILHVELDTKYDFTGSEQKELVKFVWTFCFVLFGYKLKFTEVKSTMTHCLPTTYTVNESTYFNLKFYMITVQNPEQPFRLNVSHYAFSDKNTWISKLAAKMNGRFVPIFAKAENIIMNNKKHLDKMTLTKLDKTQVKAFRWIEKYFLPNRTINKDF